MSNELGTAAYRRRLVFRAIASFQVVLVLTQSVFAGGFLSGHYGMLDMHKTTASAIAVVALAQIIASVFLLRSPERQRWPLYLGVAIFLMVGVQIPLGTERVLILHVPLAVIIIATVCHVAWRAWQPPTATADAVSPIVAEQP